MFVRSALGGSEAAGRGGQQEGALLVIINDEIVMVADGRAAPAGSGGSLGLLGALELCSISRGCLPTPRSSGQAWALAGSAGGDSGVMFSCSGTVEWEHGVLALAAAPQRAPASPHSQSSPLPPQELASLDEH